MVISNHKIKAAIVFVLAVGMGIGIPLLSRMQTADGQASLLGLVQSISCSGVQSPVKPGDTTTTVTWTSKLNFGSADLYYWMGDGTFGKGGSTIQVTYNLNKESASVTPLAAVPPAPDTQLQGNPCTVTFQQPSSTQQSGIPVPTLECSANPPAVYIGDPVVWQIKTTNITYPNLLTYIWSGAVTGQGQTMNSTHSMAGTFTATVKYDNFEIGKNQATCSVTVLEKPTQNPTPPPSSPTDQNSNPAPPAESLNTTGGATQDQSGSAAADLTPAPDILTCKIINPTIYISENKISVIRCSLKPPASVTARIVKGDYTPPDDPDAASVIKTLVYDKSMYDQTFSFNWNGIDSYDNPVPDGSYTFVVSARQSGTTKPDISIQKIQVALTRPPQTQETSAETGTPSQEQTTAPGQNPEPSAPPAEPEPPKAPEPSKCPGVNYPNDIENHWAKDFIKLAYDNCIFSGYADGGFHPDQQIMRGEAVKVALLSGGISPKLGCYDTDCGTPFLDLLTWQSQWLRAAWDLKIVKGIGDSLFVPQRAITRGEAAVLIAKAFKIPPHKNCYTPNCGAGYPGNFFIDINDPVQGSYLRALWDLQVIRGAGQNAFEPNRPMTRAEMAALLMKVAQKLGKISASQPEPAPQQSTSGQQSSTQQSSSQQISS